MREFVSTHPEIDSEWYNNSNYLALLTVSNEEDLLDFLDKAKSKGIAVASFREPDVNNELTAIALAPGKASRKLCSRLKMLGK